MAIMSYNTVKMANLSVHGSHHVNGVSGLHSDIIKDSIFKDYHDYTPQKFTNVTNGIAHRRWLNQSNPELCSLLDDCIGSGYAKDASKLADFLKYENDETVLKRLEEIATKMDAGQLPLDEAVKLYEEGMKLSKYCNWKLADVEQKVEIVNQMDFTEADVKNMEKQSTGTKTASTAKKKTKAAEKKVEVEEDIDLPFFISEEEVYHS
jgi:exodeoxyribonuclease VII small subunit